MQETKQKEIRDWEEKLLDITSMVSFCPHCLMYGTPLGLRDKICGNCGKNGLRNYIKLSSVQSFISTLLAERDAEVRKAYDELIMAVASEYQNETRHETALRYIQNAER